jgi:50S ribosomal subunit-associated GTPase HflX
VVAINKTDLVDEWKLTPADEAAVEAPGFHRVRTSAKTGEGVEAMFQWLARAAVGGKAP